MTPFQEEMVKRVETLEHKVKVEMGGLLGRVQQLETEVQVLQHKVHQIHQLHDMD